MCGSLQNQLLSTDGYHGDLGPYQVFEIVGDRRSGRLQATGDEVYATVDSVDDVKPATSTTSMSAATTPPSTAATATL